MRWLIVIALMSMAVVGCGDDADAETKDGGAVGPARELCIGRPEFTVGPTTGLLAMGEQGAINARLIDADPVPVMEDDNLWTIEFTDPKGEALDDVEILMACSFMPEHSHARRPAIKAMPEPGRVQLDPVRFHMTGVWEVQFALQSPSAPDATASAPSPKCGSASRPPPQGNEYLAFEICIPDQ